MISLYEVATIADAARFMLWTLAVVGVAKALFGSFPAAELHSWLRARMERRMMRVRMLIGWLRNGKRAPRSATNNPNADPPPPVPLTDDERRRYEAELQQMRPATLAIRAALWLLSCFLCQSFWAAVLVYLVTRGFDDLRAMLATTFAAAALAVMLATWIGVYSPPAGDPNARQRGGCPGGNCGGGQGRSNDNQRAGQRAPWISE